MATALYEQDYQEWLNRHIDLFKRVLKGNPLPEVRERIKQIKQKHGV